MDKLSKPKSALSVQTIVLAEIAWAVAALLFFLLFSVGKRDFWYSAGTSVFETVAFLAAAFLCYRNWQSPQIVSGRNVWLFIGLGMFCYFIGGLLFSYWESGLGIEPDVSPGDFFYVLTYIFLIVGMFLAVASRRLNLEIWQWGVVAVIAALGIIIAWAVSVPPDAGQPRSMLMQPAIAQTAPATKPVPKATSAGKANPKAVPAAKTQSPASANSPAVAPATTEKPVLPGQSAPATKTENANVPAWAKSFDEILKPLKPALDWFYVISDILLLIIATTLLLAFWGGRFAQSWRMIAAAAFSLYIADIWFKYATNQLKDYQSGGLLEVFWVFSGVLFGIGAALEYDLSSRSRSRGGRRRAS